jgi:hypothetical protein
MFQEYKGELMPIYPELNEKLKDVILSGKDRRKISRPKLVGI